MNKSATKKQNKTKNQKGQKTYGKGKNSENTVYVRTLVAIS